MTIILVSFGALSGTAIMFMLNKATDPKIVNQWDWYNLAFLCVFLTVFFYGLATFRELKIERKEAKAEDMKLKSAQINLRLAKWEAQSKGVDISDLEK